MNNEPCRNTLAEINYDGGDHVTTIFHCADTVAGVDESRLRAKHYRKGADRRSKQAVETYAVIQVMKHNIADSIDYEGMAGMRRLEEDEPGHYS